MLSGFIGVNIPTFIRSYKSCSNLHQNICKKWSSRIL